MPLTHPAVKYPASGFALITALIMLLVISVLALGGARLALDSKRTTRNQRDFEIAFQAAEAALRDAEMDIQNTTGPKSRSAIFQPTAATGFTVEGGCNIGTTVAAPYQGLCNTLANINAQIWNTVSWSASATNPQTVAYGTFTGRTFPTGTGLTPSQKPRYIIELLPDQSIGGAVDNTRYMYRVTAVGFGPNNATQAMVQSLYRKTDN